MSNEFLRSAILEFEDKGVILRTIYDIVNDELHIKAVRYGDDILIGSLTLSLVGK